MDMRELLLQELRSAAQDGVKHDIIMRANNTLFRSWATTTLPGCAPFIENIDDRTLRTLRNEALK